MLPPTSTQKTSQIHMLPGLKGDKITQKKGDKTTQKKKYHFPMLSYVVFSCSSVTEQFIQALLPEMPSNPSKQWSLETQFRQTCEKRKESKHQNSVHRIK